MSHQLITARAEALLGAFEADGHTASSLNNGLCADFATELHDELAGQGIEVEITGLDYYWADGGGVDDTAALRRQLVSLPPGISWEYLERLDYTNAGSHTWIEHGGLCFDSEATQGIANAFDLPCLRRSLAKIIGSDALDRMSDQHSWWRDTRELLRVWEQSVYAGPGMTAA